MKRLIAAALLVLMMLSVFTGCGEKEETPTQQAQISTQEAVQIAVTDAGYAMTDVTNAHPHTGQQDGQTVYEVHFECDGKNFTYVISATGEILSKG